MTLKLFWKLNGTIIRERNAAVNTHFSITHAPVPVPGTRREHKMCKHCRATRRLARRADRINHPHQQATQTPLTGEALAQVLSILDENAESLVSHAAMLSASTGMRMREISALKWSDIDFENKLITVRSAKNRVKRVIPMSNRIAGVLKESATSRTGARIFARGHQWLTSALNRALHGACERLKIQPVTAHSLRDSFAALVTADGISPSALFHIMGYKTPH
jgi:integrase